MILPLNADRLLARVAAASSRRGDCRPPAGIGDPTAPPAGGPVDPERPQLPTGAHLGPGPARTHLENLITTGVVGEPEQLRHALTDDARGWSPALSYSSRSEAVALLRDHISPLLVVEFAVERVWWTAPWICSEWSLVAVHAEPFLVGDDLLIDVREEPVRLAGASMIEVRDGRMATVHTYYDEGSLVEQVILANRPRAGRTRGFRFRR